MAGSQLTMSHEMRDAARLHEIDSRAIRVYGARILIRRIDAHCVATACLIDLRRSGAFDAKAASA
jgi:hypothetical protein